MCGRSHGRSSRICSKRQAMRGSSGTIRIQTTSSRWISIPTAICRRLTRCVVLSTRHTTASAWKFFPKRKPLRALFRLVFIRSSPTRSSLFVGVRQLMRRNCPSMSTMPGTVRLPIVSARPSTNGQESGRSRNSRAATPPSHPNKETRHPAFILNFHRRASMFQLRIFFRHLMPSAAAPLRLSAVWSSYSFWSSTSSFMSRRVIFSVPACP